MRPKLFWKRLFCCYEAVVGRIANITADEEIIIQISTILITGLGVVIDIDKFGGVGLCCRRRGATTDASLEARWLA